MPTKLSKYKQSIYDMVAENFGTLDYLVKVSSDNGFPISDLLNTGTSLIFDNENLGNKTIKEAIINKGYNFNNNYVPIITGDWILETGFWNDSGAWIDTKFWID